MNVSAAEIWSYIIIIQIKQQKHIQTEYLLSR